MTSLKKIPVLENRGGGCAEMNGSPPLLLYQQEQTLEGKTTLGENERVEIFPSTVG